MMKFTHFMLIPTAVAAAMAAAACDSGESSSDDGGDEGGSSGSSTGGSSTGGASGSSTGGASGSSTGGASGTTGDPTGTVLQPSADGWMDMMDVWNNMGIQGSWYPYGDQYGMGEGDAKCTTVGLHPAADCSTITTPAPPPATGFPNTGGMMCTSGDVTQVKPCEADLLTRCPTCSGCPDFDYSTMWGAGIGFDINAEKGELGGAKHVWDPAAYGVIGFEFDLDTIPLGGKFRVEIPMQLTDAELALVTPPLPAGSTTDSHPDGAPYWGASSSYPNSPVVVGKNRVLWADIKPPRPTSYTFEPARMLGIQFHVPASTDARLPYSFCISNVKLIKQ